MPMKLRLVSTLLSVAAIFHACAPDPEERSEPLPFTHAYVHDDCAPWDGPALSIVFGHEEVESPFDEAYPSLRITSYRPPAELAGGVLEWADEAHDVGYAAWCESAGSCRVPASVRVRLDRRQPSPDLLTGQVRVELADGRILSGRFEAQRLRFQALCG